MMTPSASEAGPPTQMTVSDDDRGDRGRDTGLLDPVGRIGRYVILRRVGQGGMGVVYAGYDEQLDRKVAIKLLRQRTRHAARRLGREAQALAKLSHPNVVQVYESGEHDGDAFIAMEFVEGQTLGAWSRAQPRGWREALTVMTEAGRGLAAAHAKGLVHRDFKPDNVMIDGDGRVRVMDFGLVHGALATDSGNSEDHGFDHGAEDTEPGTGERERFGSEVVTSETLSGHDPLSEPLTQTESALGTPAYMPPEQHSGLPTDARSDQFSYCVALWELVYGRRPFVGKSVAALYLAVAQRELSEPPRDIDVPAWLRKVVERGLAIDPRDRWPDMDALLAALADDPRPRRWLSAIGVVLMLVGVTGFAVHDARIDRAQEAALADCTREARVIESLWTASTEAELEPGFVAVGGRRVVGSGRARPCP